MGGAIVLRGDCPPPPPVDPVVVVVVVEPPLDDDEEDLDDLALAKSIPVDR